MKLKKLMMAALTLMCSAAVMAQQPIPTDPEVRIGKLDNGLTYYIRHNAWPEQRAEFYIAQRVGAIQENDDQRGLAHFLEHMCFNGTEHFKGNDIVKWCETIGVKFGRDLNAYTSIDRTVYNISNVPTTREGIIDSCLLILHDWADGLLLEPEEIQKERGVIHEEWRMRTSAQMRMLERDLPKLYPGSKYGHRMPIGLMEIIDNFKPQVLRDYYEKWYRPDNQAVIVVGDFDVDKEFQGFGAEDVCQPWQYWSFMEFNIPTPIKMAGNVASPGSFTMTADDGSITLSVIDPIVPFMTGTWEGDYQISFYPNMTYVLCFDSPVVSLFGKKAEWYAYHGGKWSYSFSPEGVDCYTINLTPFTSCQIVTLWTDHVDFEDDPDNEVDRYWGYVQEDGYDEFTVYIPDLKETFGFVNVLPGGSGEWQDFFHRGVKEFMESLD